MKSSTACAFGPVWADAVCACAGWPASEGSNTSAMDSFFMVVLVVFLVSFSLTALGFAIAWPMDSNQAFHAIINLFLIPLWLLSGSLFPLSGASGWMRILMEINPLTYGVEALRMLLYPGSPSQFSLTDSMATLLLFTLFMFGLAFVMVNRRTTKPAA